MRTTSFDKRIIIFLLSTFSILFHLSAQMKSPREKILINDGYLSQKLRETEAQRLNKIRDIIKVRIT